MTHEDWGHIISKEKAGMYAGILRCTISEQEGEHTVFQNQIGAFTVFNTAQSSRRLECGFKLLCAIQWVQSCVLNSVKRKALTRTHGLEPRSRNGWLKWAEYEIRLQNVFDVSSKFAHRNSGGRANWLGSLFSHEYL